MQRRQQTGTFSNIVAKQPCCNDVVEAGAITRQPLSSIRLRIILSLVVLQLLSGILQ